MINGTEEYWYQEAELSEVPLNLRQAAEKTIKFCKQYLGLPAIEIIWMRKVSEWERGFAKLDKIFSRACGKRPNTFESDIQIAGQVRGFTDGLIWVSLDLSPDEVIKTVAHEARHLFQLQKYRPPFTQQERDFSEKDAVEFERLAWRNLK